MDVLVTTGLLAVFVSGWLLAIKYVIESRIYARLLVWSTGKALPTIGTIRTLIGLRTSQTTVTFRATGPGVHLPSG